MKKRTAARKKRPKCSANGQNGGQNGAAWKRAVRSSKKINKKDV
jgi:hypothetical protein